MAWIAAGIMGVTAVAALGYSIGRSSSDGTGGQAATPIAQGGFGQATTDLSTMTPREQADRLFDRVIIAHEQGDVQQVEFFAPMAVQAYDIVGTLDADARYHIGLIGAITGQLEAALAQADSLEFQVPGHLMAAMLRNSVARTLDDPAAMASSYRSFVEHYEAEIAAGRTEYEQHSTPIASFRAEAEQAVQATGG